MQHATFHITQLGGRQGSTLRVLLSGPFEGDAPIGVRLEPGYGHPPNRGMVGWHSERFEWPFDLLEGAGAQEGPALRTIMCQRTSTRWGTYWRGELPLDVDAGLYRLEIADGRGISAPFEIGSHVYQRIVTGYLAYLRHQRAGEETAGVSGPLFLDDARTDDGQQQRIAPGGWYDAGDYRQWTSTTALHLSALADIATEGHQSWLAAATEELAWGRDYFTHLACDGQVPDNVGGGKLPPGYGLEDWWFENHAGTLADGSGAIPSDDIPASGDERIAMMQRNPHAENVLIRELASASQVGSRVGAARSRMVAELIWRRSEASGADDRTLFLASRLRAATALAQLPHPIVTPDLLSDLARTLLTRQRVAAGGDEVLSGYFLEAPAARAAFRSIPYSCEPALALLDALDHVPIDLAQNLTRALERYIEDYLLADAESNPFGLPPYGVYLDGEVDDTKQTLRRIGPDASVRTFMAPWNQQSIVHGTSAVLTHQAYLLARAGQRFQRSRWLDAAERVLHWITGGNPANLSLIMGIGHRHPVAFSPRLPSMPGAVFNGFIGREDDSPYVETTEAVAWNTQEVYGVATVYAAQAALILADATHTDFTTVSLT